MHPGLGVGVEGMRSGSSKGRAGCVSSEVSAAVVKARGTALN